MENRGSLESGVLIKEMPKGIPRTKYYTPDGREQYKIPQHRLRSDGVVYDVFLAQGYTLTPPTNPKLYCKGCDMWHDTQGEVEGCIKKKGEYAKAMQKRAEGELGKEKDTEIADLKKQIANLTKLVEDKLGKEIQ